MDHTTAFVLAEEKGGVGGARFAGMLEVCVYLCVVEMHFSPL